MKIQRKDPLGVIKNVDNKAAETSGAPPLSASAASALGTKKVTAGVTNTVLGACPICQQDMAIVDTDGIPSYVCIDHCVCLPTKDF